MNARGDVEIRSHQSAFMVYAMLGLGTVVQCGIGHVMWRFYHSLSALSREERLLLRAFKANRSLDDSH